METRPARALDPTPTPLPARRPRRDTLRTTPALRCYVSSHPPSGGRSPQPKRSPAPVQSLVRSPAAARAKDRGAFRILVASRRPPRSCEGRRRALPPPAGITVGSGSPAPSRPPQLAMLWPSVSLTLPAAFGAPAHREAETPGPAAPSVRGTSSRSSDAKSSLANRKKRATTRVQPHATEIQALRAGRGAAGGTRGGPPPRDPLAHGTGAQHTVNGACFAMLRPSTR